MPLQCGSMHTRSPQLGRAQLTQCCTPSRPYPNTVHALLLPLPATAAQCTTHANNAHPLRHLLPLSANNRAHASAIGVHAHSARNTSDREATHTSSCVVAPAPTSPTHNQPHPEHNKQAVCRTVCVMGSNALAVQWNLLRHSTCAHRTKERRQTAGSSILSPLLVTFHANTPGVAGHTFADVSMGCWTITDLAMRIVIVIRACHITEPPMKPSCWVRLLAAAAAAAAAKPAGRRTPPSAIAKKAAIQRSSLAQACHVAVKQ